MALSTFRNKKVLAAVGILGGLLVGGIAFADSDSGGDSTDFALAATIRGFGVDYAATGASQIRGDGGGGGSDCSAQNLASSSAALAVPAGSTVLRAMLYWVGLEKHESRGYSSSRRLADVTQMRLPSGANVAVKGQRRLEAKGEFNGGAVEYAGYQADVTTQLSGAVSGDYNVTINGGIPNLCAYSGENARAWQLVVVYDTPSPDYSIVYLYDGMNFLSHSATPITIRGFTAEAGRESTLTAFVAQGDSTLAGEYANVSDRTFGNFPNNFANETVNGSASGANGQAIDIDTITGDLVPGSTTLTISYGTTQDVILPVTFALRLASLPPSPPPTTTTAATVPTTVPATTVPATTVPTTTVPTTTVPGSPTTAAATTVPAGPTTVPAAPTTVALDPDTTEVVVAVTVTAPPTSTTTSTVPIMAVT
jgi:hypothetical protein